MKRCSRCGETKPLDAFYPSRTRKSGLTNDCRPCALARNAEYRDRTRSARRPYRRALDAKPERREAKLAYMREYQRRPDVRAKKRARTALATALLRGDLTRPTSCDRCGQTPDVGVVEAHHPDHARPLVVEWLCKVCHATEHPLARHS